MNHHETAQILKRALDSLDDHRLTTHLNEANTLVGFIEKLQPGSSEDLQNRLPLQICKANENPDSDKDELVRLCEQSPHAGFRIAGEKWFEANPKSFLKACQAYPREAVFYCAKAWYALDPEECLEAMERNHSNSMFNLSEELLVDNPEKLLANFETYSEFIWEETPETWAKLSPESYIKNCRKNPGKVFKYKEATLIWKDLDEDGCLLAFKETDLLLDEQVAPEVLLLIAEIYPKKVASALPGTSYSGAVLNHPGLWWELDPETFLKETTKNLWPALLCAPYMTDDMKASILTALGEIPARARKGGEGRLEKALANETWGTDGVLAAFSHTLGLLVNPGRAGRDTEYHQTAFTWEINKGVELNLVDSMEEHLLKRTQSGALSPVVLNLPTYPGHSLDRKLEDLEIIFDTSDASANRYAPGGILAPLKAIAFTLEGVSENKEALLSSVKAGKVPLTDGASNLVGYLLDDEEARELTGYILDTPGMDADTLRWALERAGNLNTQPRVNIKKTRTNGTQEGLGVA